MLLALQSCLSYEPRRKNVDFSGILGFGGTEELGPRTGGLRGRETSTESTEEKRAG